MELITSVNSKIEENKTEMISSLSKLISIPSVAAKRKGSMPFGENVDRAYRCMLEMAESQGFSIFDADGYGGHIDYAGREPEIVGIVGHLDVVPEGDGWDFEPYGAEVIDGYICGRGTMDDKGPVIASFYAMKALKECGYEPKRTIRMILGLDEETNWQGMDYYLSEVGQLPEFGFTPDGDFPAIHGEMGILVFDIAKKFSQSSAKGLELSSLNGGTAANSVADYARAVLHNSAGEGYENVKKSVSDFRGAKGCKINCKGIGKSFEITVQGISAHGSKPEQGLNAISIIMEFLEQFNFVNEDANDFIDFYNNCIGYHLHGENMGCDFADDVSGRLVFNVGKISLDKKAAQLTINVRYPVTMDDEAVYDGIMSILNHYELGIVKGKHQQPIYIPEDDQIICTLMDIYKKHTKDTESKPLVIGGGTYARAIKSTVAFGARFPEQPELGHQKNEKISVDNMVKLAKIYAEAIYRLSEM
ncbi:MAG: dipeptidase PepV [Clostridiales bacterium]|nr:dipeptidase PepV [Clostridiales bacterium]